jgi:6-phosphogluconolactonase
LALLAVYKSIMQQTQLYKALVGGLFLVSMLCGGVRAADIPAGSTVLYVGTYTNDAKSKGIYAFKVQKQDGASQNVTLEPLGLAAESASPSFLEVDQKRGLLFSVNEVNQSGGKPSGAVSAFKINPQTGMLTAINQQPTMGRGPCHLLLDKTGKNLLVANYVGGNVAVIPVGADGKLGEATSVIQHRGKSVNPQRQEAPHAHGVVLDAANRFAFVCDLGLDKVMIYKFDAESGKLTANEPAFAEVKPGSGPRHMVFRPDGKFAYVNNEMTSTVTAFAYDAEAGKLSEVQTISTLPGGVAVPGNSTAEIQAHPSGKFLYVSNRGHDSVALFNIDQEKGTLTFVEAQSTGGKVPRHFGIDPSGKQIVVENQRSGQVMICPIDENGKWKSNGLFVEVGSPVCAVFVTVGEGK